MNTIDICNEDSLSCAFDLTTLILGTLQLILNIFAVFKMCIMQRRIKFENLVIFTGIIQSVTIIIVTLTKFEFLLQLAIFFQISIYLYIIRRFLRIIVKIQLGHTPNYSYNVFFFIMQTVNLGFLLALIVFTFVKNKIQTYFIFSYGIFTFLISLNLLYVGLKVKALINMTVKEIDSRVFNTYLNKTQTNSIRDSSVMKGKLSKGEETYNQIRKQQINLITFVYVISCIYQLIYLVLKHHLLKKEFRLESLKTFTLTDVSKILHFVYLFFVSLSVLMNYFAFYYLIRKSFDIPAPAPKRFGRLSVFSNESFAERNERFLSSKEIDEFLS